MEVRKKLKRLAILHSYGVFDIIETAELTFYFLSIAKGALLSDIEINQALNKANQYGIKLSFQDLVNNKVVEPVQQEYRIMYKINYPVPIEPLLRRFNRLQHNFIELGDEVIFLNVKNFKIAEVLDVELDGVKFYVGIEGKDKIPPNILVSFKDIPRGEAQYFVIPADTEIMQLLVSNPALPRRIYKKLKSITTLTYREPETTASGSVREREVFPDTLDKFKAYLTLTGSVVYKIQDPKEFAIRIADNPTLINNLVNSLFSGFDQRLSEVYLAMGIKLPNKERLLRYGTHIINFDRTNAGKTLGAKLVGGLVLDKVTASSLTGFATANEIKPSIINKVSGLVCVDEIETERDSSLYSKLLNLLKDGECRISSAGALLRTITWASITFNGNVRYAHEQDVNRRAKEFYETLKKITDNLEAMASRFALFNYYQVEQLDPSIEINTDLAILLEGLESIVGEITEKFLLAKEFSWVRELLEKPWHEEHIKQIQEIANSVMVNEIRELIYNIPNNFRKLNCLALKMTIWYFFRQLGKDMLDYFSNVLDPSRKEMFIKKFEEYKNMLEVWNINSFRSFVETNEALIESFVEYTVKNLSPRALLFLQLLKDYCKEGGDVVAGLISFQTLQSLENSKALGEILEKSESVSKFIYGMRTTTLTRLESLGIKFVKGGLEIKHPAILKKAFEVLEAIEE